MDYITYIQSIKEILNGEHHDKEEILDLILEQSRIFITVIEVQKQLLQQLQQRISSIENQQKDLNENVSSLEERISRL
jgi:predicted nuclease with TOPRIM domain